MESIHKDARRRCNKKEICYEKKIVANNNHVYVEKKDKSIVIDDDYVVEEYPSMIIIETEKSVTIKLTTPTEDTHFVVKNMSDIDAIVYSDDLIDMEKAVFIQNKYDSFSLFFSAYKKSWYIL